MFTMLVAASLPPDFWTHAEPRRPDSMALRIRSAGLGQSSMRPNSGVQCWAEAMWCLIWARGLGLKASWG